MDEGRDIERLRNEVRTSENSTDVGFIIYQFYYGFWVWTIKKRYAWTSDDCIPLYLYMGTSNTHTFIFGKVAYSLNN